MNERSYLLLVGVYILSALYLEIDMMIYGLCAVLLFEGLTDLRITTTLQKIRKVTLDTGLVVFNTRQRVNLEALRTMRILIATILLTTYLLMYQYELDVLWFIPWALGFVLMGAGASSICPMLLFLRWAGLR